MDEIVSTVKFPALTFTPLVYTTRLPLVAPLGTGTTIWPAAQLVGVAVVPLNVTVLEPCDEPKLAPEIVTDIPTAAKVGETLEIVGVGKTVKLFPLLANPATVTTTLPVVAPLGTDVWICVFVQLVGVA
jgi:hypothetical protein